MKRSGGHAATSLTNPVVRGVPDSVNRQSNFWILQLQNSNKSSVQNIQKLWKTLHVQLMLDQEMTHAICFVAETVQKTTEEPQSKFIDEVVSIPFVAQRHVLVKLKKHETA